MIKFGNYLNKTILVSIPSVFKDDQPRPFRLVGIELVGLWLESEDLARKLYPPEKDRPAPATLVALFPYSQIAYVLNRWQPAANAGAPAKPASAEGAHSKADPGTKPNPSGTRKKSQGTG